MQITLRGEKGAPLTHEEMDGNNLLIRELLARVDALEGGVDVLASRLEEALETIGGELDIDLLFQPINLYDLEGTLWGVYAGEGEMTRFDGTVTYWRVATETDAHGNPYRDYYQQDGGGDTEPWYFHCYGDDADNPKIIDQNGVLVASKNPMPPPS